MSQRGRERERKTHCIEGVGTGFAFEEHSDDLRTLVVGCEGDQRPSFLAKGPVESEVASLGCSKEEAHNLPSCWLRPRRGERDCLAEVREASMSARVPSSRSCFFLNRLVRVS